MTDVSVKPYVHDLLADELALARQSAAEFAAEIRAARERAGKDALVVVWVSDIHLRAPRAYAPGTLSRPYATEVDCSALLRVALAEVAALEPCHDLLVFGGDIADSGCGGEAPDYEYKEMKHLLDLFLPAAWRTLPVLGNHDHADRPLSPAWHAAWARMRRADWPEPVETDDFYYAARVGGWRFIALDSRQGQPLSEPQRDWLRAELQADAATPTVVMLHRPFVSVGNWVDDCSLRDRGSFDIIDRSPSVRAVIAGHAHKAAHWDYRGKRHMVFPALAYGIPDPCGWGVMVLDGNDVREVFVKDVAMKSFDSVRCRMHPATGAYRELPAARYEDSPLCNPLTLPHPLLSYV